MKRRECGPKSYYPIFADLAGKRCVVVGGGRVAERKVKTLLDHGARVVVVSPRLTAGLSRLKKRGAIEHTGRGFRPGDTRNGFMVFAATDDRARNEAVAAEVFARAGMVNTVDDPELCSFIVPSVVRRGPLSIAISTSGRSPALSKAIRKHLEKQFDADFGAAISSLGELRGQLKKEPGCSALSRRRRLVNAAKQVMAKAGPGGVKGSRSRCR